MISRAREQFAGILAIDFEAVPDGDLFHMAAVLGSESFELRDIKDARAALEKLSDFSRGAEYVLGHNIIAHDLALAAGILPDAGFLKLPAVDTLYLSPLAFPENPYHKLVKDYKIVRTSKNNPVEDIRLALAVFEDQMAAFEFFRENEPDLISFFAFAFSPAQDEGSDMVGFSGIARVFTSMAGKAPGLDEAKAIFTRTAGEKICTNALDEIWNEFSTDSRKRPGLAYILSWIRVSGANSVIPPWVRHEFSFIMPAVQKLRYSCGRADCVYCRSINDSRRLLKKYFGFNDYRTLDDGRQLQREIVEASLAGISHLAVLPTGAGKSICYQIPALHRYHRTGELTIVISPLKALMKDQVDNLNRATGLEAAAAINGSLTLPERGAVMEKVRLGDIGILYISPEQLRNFSVAELVRSRDVGYWVFDEAHCLSKWGHDFRPDYLYVAEFIMEYHKAVHTGPLVGAFTATAKQDVIQEIKEHFADKLNFEPAGFIGGVQRNNLKFQVWPVTANEKYDVILNCIKECIESGDNDEGGVIVYCASRKNTENITRFLNERNIDSRAFHAGISEPEKRNIQDDFVGGKIPVICATNAFGMGIDKKDIRLVIHADIPGSLENYLQEAGRAGRDMKTSECILLYEQEDIENQFTLNSYSKLSLRDIKKILKVLKKRGKITPEIIITPGEIMRLAGSSSFEASDTKARAGVAWLEKRGFIKRFYNRTLFFTGVPLVEDMDQAVEKINSLGLSRVMQEIYKTIIHTLFNSEKDDILSADAICDRLGTIANLPEKYMDPANVIRVLSDMAEAGLIRQGVVMTAFVRPKGRQSSGKLLDYFIDLEKNMLAQMQVMSPDSYMNSDTPDIINLRMMSQHLKDMGFEQANTDAVEKILRTMANDKGKDKGTSLKISGRSGSEHQRVYIRFPWQEIERRMKLRHNAARVCLETMIQALPDHLRKGQAQVLAEFFISDMANAMRSDVFLSGYRGDINSLIESCLLFMHDLKVITLQNGLSVFRQAMTLYLLPGADTRQYTRADYAPLSHHYAQKNVQVHVMEKYARLGLEKIRAARKFVSDYFESSYETFIKQYFPGRKKIIQTAMTADAYQKIVQSLGNPVQEAVVTAPPEKNILVLAGPGSGKTKTIVHRCAWLIRAGSVPASSILVLCFNHQAMTELRKRIRALAGKIAGRITALTYHGFAMRLTGRAFFEHYMPGRIAGNMDFDLIIDEAIDILDGRKQVPGIDQSQVREYFLAGYRCILVDEYQDIDERQYRLICALTGRLEKDRDSKISIMAVGDDDQSIYGFRNANVRFIRQFMNDYGAKTYFLVENYRSSLPIIETANSFIALNRNRMKTDHPCCINRRRHSQISDPENIDESLFVHLVNVKNIETQAVFVASQIKQILSENSEISPGDIAVVSRHGISYPCLVAMRIALAKQKISFCRTLKNSAGFSILKIRQIQDFIHYLEKHKKHSLTPDELKDRVMAMFGNVRDIWTDHIETILDSWCIINSETSVSLAVARDFAVESLIGIKREFKAGEGVFLGTVHSVKGMEFNSVFILDGGWKSSDIEEERRLFYVGMTRARENLYICRFENSDNPHADALENSAFVRTINWPESRLDGFSRNLTISILGMEDLYLSYPGQFPDSHEIHARLSELKTGDRVRLRQGAGRIYIKSVPDNITIGALSKKSSEKWRKNLDLIVTARVLGIVRRTGQEETGGNISRLKCDAWELPVLEILHKTGPGAAGGRL